MSIKQNQIKIWNYILVNGGYLPDTRIARDTGLTRQTVRKIIEQFKKDGNIKEYKNRCYEPIYLNPPASVPRDYEIFIITHMNEKMQIILDAIGCTDNIKKIESKYNGVERLGKDTFFCANKRASEIAYSQNIHLISEDGEDLGRGQDNRIRNGITGKWMDIDEASGYKLDIK